MVKEGFTEGMKFSQIQRMRRQHGKSRRKSVNQAKAQGQKEFSVFKGVARRILVCVGAGVWGGG